MRVAWRPDAENAYLTSGFDNLALHQTPAGEGCDPACGPLDHFGLLVAKAEDVDAWARRLEASGVALAQPPKTHRDGARSIYFHDPEGNLIQLLHIPDL
jgi:catechol 2,3-dioxygenase-like lactoylglutathione lyase family enzyme